MTPAEIEEKYQDAISMETTPAMRGKFAGVRVFISRAVNLSRTMREHSMVWEYLRRSAPVDDAEDAIESRRICANNPDVMALSFVLVEPRSGA